MLVIQFKPIVQSDLDCFKNIVMQENEFSTGVDKKDFWQNDIVEFTLNKYFDCINDMYSLLNTKLNRYSIDGFLCIENI